MGNDVGMGRATLKPSKKKSTERIDGIVATIMALGQAMVRDTIESDGALKLI